MGACHRCARYLVGACVLPLLIGCASTVKGTDGSEVRVGYGNRIQAAGVVVEPSPVVVDAAERVAEKVAARMSERILQQAVEQANK